MANQKMTTAEKLAEIKAKKLELGGDWSFWPDYDAAESGLHDYWYPVCLLYTSPSPRDATLSRMPSSA